MNYEYYESMLNSLTLCSILWYILLHEPTTRIDFTGILIIAFIGDIHVKLQDNYHAKIYDPSNKRCRLKNKPGGRASNIDGLQ